MWFLILHGFLAVWVFLDGFKRKLNIIPWAIGTIILGPIILPIYIEKRPLKSGEFRLSSRALNSIKYLAIFWTVLLVAVTIWSQKKNIYSSIENETLEYRLAVINDGNQVCKKDNMVKRFGNLLDQLSENCYENRQQIANISVIAHNKISANGMNESLLDMMEDLNKLFYKELRNEKYSNYVFLYIGLRNKGLSHNESIQRLKASIEGY